MLAFKRLVEISEGRIFIFEGGEIIEGEGKKEGRGGHFWTRKMKKGFLETVRCGCYKSKKGERRGSRRRKLERQCIVST